MDGSIEQDDLPTTQRPKVSDNSIEVVDVGSEEPKISADPIKNADDEAAPSNGLSKRQRKKLLKLADWEEKKKVKRLKEREKYKQKRLDAIANGLPTRTGPSRKALKRNRMDDSTNPFTVAIDLDFDDLMIDKDICKCAKQLLWVYTINRKSESRCLHLHYTGLKTGGRLHQAMQRNDGYQNWDIKITEDSFLNVFKTEQIVYLTSDSDNVLTELDPNAVYIIGGLVDHNHHKGISLRRAEERGLRTARLPLSEHISIKTRTVLTIVHVFDILLKVSQGQSWQDALLEVLPSRKGAKPLDRNDENVEES